MVHNQGYYFYVSSQLRNQNPSNMHKQLLFFISLLLFISCEKKVVDKEPLFTFSTTGDGVYQFKSDADNATSWEWNFGDGSTSTEKDPTHTYTKNGNYTVVLIAKNKKGQVTKVYQIEVNDAPKPMGDFTFTNEGNGQVSFKNNSTNAESYVWDLGDGETSTDKDLIHNYARNGTYQVVLTVKNFNGETESKQEVIISDAPKPVVSFTLKSNGNDQISFTNTTTNAESYVWDFGNGSTSTENNPTHTYTKNGTYEVKLTAKNFNGESFIVQNVTIADATKPTANFSFRNGSGGVVYFDHQSTNYESINWSFGDGRTSSNERPTIVYSKNGNYNVVLTAKNQNGEGTITKTVTISNIYVAP
jgi:PKD repeat protein